MMAQLQNLRAAVVDVGWLASPALQRARYAVYAVVLLLYSNAGLPVFWPDATDRGYAIYRGLAAVMVLLVSLPLLPRIWVFLRGERMSLVFLFWSLFTILWSDDRIESVRYVVQAVILVLFIAALLTDLGVLAGLRLVATTVTVTSTASLLVSWLAPSVGLIHVHHPAAGFTVQVVGVFGWNSELGLTSAVGFIAGVILLYCERRWFYVLFIVVNALALYVSDSATSWVAAFVAFCAVLLFVFRKWLKWIGIVACVALIVVCIIGFQRVLDLVFEVLGRSPDLTLRDTIWAATLEEISNRPIVGHGAGVVADYQALIERSVDHAHNGFLQIAYDRGWLGLTIVVAMVIYAAIRLTRAGSSAVLVAPMLLLALVTNVANSYLTGISFGAVLFLWSLAAARWLLDSTRNGEPKAIAPKQLA